MSSLYDQIGEACKQFGERVGASLKEANDLMATNSRRERGMNENLADEIRQQIEKCKDLKLAVGEINNHLSVLEGLTRKDIMEQADEAYQKGYDKGYADKTNNDEVCKQIAKDIQDKAYQRGLEDGKAVNDKGCEGCMYQDNTIEHHPCGVCCNAYHNQWTAKKSDNRIEIGDEVEWNGDKYIVTYRNTSMGVIQDYDMLAYDGSVADHVKKCSFIKTGRHFDIASILKEMQND